MSFRVGSINSGQAMSPSLMDATGSVMKQVRCERCGYQYSYEMTRTAIGSYSGFALTRQEADEKAAANAAQRLKTMLETECDVVPCPSCGALTRQMKKFKAAFAPMCFGGLAFGALVMGGVYLYGKWSGRWFVVLGLLGLGMFLLSGFVLLCSAWEFITGSANKR